jgi:hypothetical protein
MALISNAPIVIPKGGDTLNKRDSIVTLTGKNFNYETRISPRSGTPKYFTISENPLPNLTFDRLSGKLSGLVTVSGVFYYRITAYNDYGKDYVDLELAVRKRGFTSENYLSELAESADLQKEAQKNLNIDPDMLPILQAVAEENPPFIRNDFMGIVGFSKNKTASENDVQAQIDSATALVTSINSSITVKLTNTQEPENNITSPGVFIATTFWRGSFATAAEITPSESLDLPTGQVQWSQIEGDGDKIQITPPTGRNTVLIEGSLTVANGITVANTYFAKGTANFTTAKTDCENSPSTKIKHYNIAVGDIAVKLPVYKP